jgi:uncharacterized protein
MEIINNKEESRFELEIDNWKAILEYEIKNDRMYLISTKVPDALAGQGIGKKLVTLAIDQIESMDLKIIPVCSFVKTWFLRHPEKNDLLD